MGELMNRKDVMKKEGYLLDEITFCSDGVLKLKYDSGDKMLPLDLIQKDLNQTEIEFLVTCLNSRIVFSKGLTLRGFFDCFRPWVESVSLLTKRDMQAYINICNNVATNHIKDGKYAVIYKTNHFYEGCKGVNNGKDFVGFNSVYRLECKDINFNRDFSKVLDLPLYLVGLEKTTISDNSLAADDLDNFKLNGFLNATNIMGVKNNDFEEGQTFKSSWDSKKDFTFREILFDVLPLFSKYPIEEKPSDGEYRKEIEDFIAKFSDYNFDDVEVFATQSDKDKYYESLASDYGIGENGFDIEVAPHVLPIISVR